MRVFSLFRARGNRGNPLILTEEDRVLKTLSSFKEALNQRDIEGILSFFSRDYRDSSRVGYKDLRGIFEKFFREMRGEKSYPIFYFYNPRVRIRGDMAEVELKLLIRGSLIRRDRPSSGYVPKRFSPTHRNALKTNNP